MSSLARVDYQHRTHNADQISGNQEASEVSTEREGNSLGGVGDVSDSFSSAVGQMQPEILPLFKLSTEHEEYVVKFMSDLHTVATQDDRVQLPQVVRLGLFFRERHSHLVQKYQEERLSSIAALKFLYVNEELRQKVIEGITSLNTPSWLAIRTAVYFIYSPRSEPRIRGEVYMFCGQDSLAKEKGWKGDVIMRYITEQSLQKFIQYIFLGIET